MRRESRTAIWPKNGRRPTRVTYVFHLRSGVKFHDGRPLTSADVKYTFDSILDRTVTSPKRGSLAMIQIHRRPGRGHSDFSFAASRTPGFCGHSRGLRSGSSPRVPGRILTSGSPAPARSGSSARIRTTTLCSKGMTSISAARRTFRACNSASCPMPLCARWNCAKEARTWK